MAIASGQEDTAGSLIPPGSVGPVPAIAPTYITEDMNASTGGVARETSIGGTWENVYSVTGSGLFFGFLVTLEDEKKWRIRFIVDGNEIFGANGIKTDDLDDKDIYGYNFHNIDDRGYDFHQGISLGEKTVAVQGPLGYPISYESSVVVKLIKDSGGSKKFRAGLATRTI